MSGHRRRRVLGVGLVVLGYLALAIGGMADHFLFVAFRDHDNARAAAARVALCYYVNDHALAPLRGLLESARAATERNPLPPAPSDEQRRFYEDQRARAREFYRSALYLTTPENCQDLSKGSTP